MKAKLNNTSTQRWTTDWDFAICCVDLLQLFNALLFYFQNQLTINLGSFIPEPWVSLCIIAGINFLCSLMLSFKLVLSRVESLKLGSFILIIFQRYQWLYEYQDSKPALRCSSFLQTRKYLKCSKKKHCSNWKNVSNVPTLIWFWTRW